METIIQSVEVKPYRQLVVLPFLYQTPNNAALFIDGKKYILDSIRDDIQLDGTITRYLRVFNQNP